MVELKRKTSGENMFTMEVGRRVFCDGHYGTIRFIGEVPPTKGIWLGIDWDHPLRGKHDGTYNGVQYFTASYPKSGSLVRPEKLNFGCSIVESIRTRYGTPQSEEELAKAEETMQEVQRSIKARFFEVVGFDKVEANLSHLQSLQIVSLAGLPVNGPGPLPELQLVCPNITELDLSHTLLHSWDSVAAISGQLVNLSVLNISENRLAPPEDVKELRPAFDSLHTLIMARCSYNWSDILSFSGMWPNIKHLKIMFNAISEISEPADTLLNLESLDLEGNVISWEDVESLSKLTFFRSLNLTNTHLHDISVSQPLEGYFVALKHLNITNNSISGWLSVSELNKLPGLEELRFKKNPLVDQGDCTPETVRQLIIARISNLKSLNGVVISSSERKGAENDYVNLYGPVWLEASKSEDKKARFLAYHPRYLELIEKYGPPESQESVKKSPLITVHLCRGDDSGPNHTRKLPSSMLIQRLANLVQRLFNVSHQNLKLSYISSKHPDQEIALENHLKSLGFYSVSDNDRIIVRW
nr:PREDICTED: tubulin-specific chaperone E [Bemisia tabaci]XP_018901158.1 PREDICTED: tubulin-specific chaperone E [Bemisia tabaci]XP_018901159.1 PREDICTED: tubulin-specific chaperone E [Bemisia tabaci]XP_018901160.1 PREDICTED: tubulin-specific chaperone E [Bemisia tabaci]XP_018901161.1 PREDICTED: tubulin-specific chaperone E [Bemisia tabaci]